MRKKNAAVREAAKKGESANPDQVRLPVICGVRPGVYLAGIYACVLIIILFFALVYPGLAKPGSLVVFNSEPWGAALRVDGLYAGTSPAKIFVPKGSHTLEAVLPGFTSECVECAIPGRVFASSIFPRKYPFSVNLRAENPAAVLTEAAKDYAAWTFGGEPTSSWQIPLSLSEGAYRVGMDTPPESEELLTAAARFAVTRAALRDLARAKFFTDSGGLSPSPPGLYKTAGGIADFLSQTPGAAAWLKDTLGADAAAVIEASAWYKKQVASLSAPTAATGENPPARAFNLGGLSYTGVAGAVYKNAPIAAFMICDSEVSAASFETFLAENPEWDASRRETLVTQGLASGEYLRDEKPEGLAIGGIAGVSWFAAQAYCEWLGGRLPPSMADYEVRLPFEAEWEYSASIGAHPGGLWEWCADPYAPLAFRVTNEAAQSLGSPERSLRGISGAAGADNFSERGSLPPEFCSPFVSFRPVIARKDSSRVSAR